MFNSGERATDGGGLLCRDGESRVPKLRVVPGGAKREADAVADALGWNAFQVMCDDGLICGFLLCTPIMKGFINGKSDGNATQLAVVLELLL